VWCGNVTSVQLGSAPEGVAITNLHLDPVGFPAWTARPDGSAPEEGDIVLRLTGPGGTIAPHVTEHGRAARAEHAADVPAARGRDADRGHRALHVRVPGSVQ
jgi:hypothetical protein